VAAAVVAIAGCGGSDRPKATPADGVRSAVRAYIGALSAQDWSRACGLMTPTARRDLADAAGASCARALADGAAPEELASAQREVAGAGVRIRGTAATLGPLGTAQQAVRLRKVGGRWLVDG
jgi:hypothetical protein